MNPIPTKTPRTVLWIALLAIHLIPALAAEPAAPTWGAAKDNKIFAQKLVDDTLARHPELIVVGLHATPPGARDQCIIAINLDRIGKLDDEEDRGIVEAHKIILEPNLKDPTRFEVQLELLDSAGRPLPVGAAIVFDRRKVADQPVDYLERALAIRAEMSRQVPDFAHLFVRLP